MAMNPVVHFEMPAVDRKRMTDFYTRAFGWKTQQLGPEMGNYVVVTTHEADDKGIRRSGAINGGFYPKSDDPLTRGPSVVIAVDDIQAHMKKVVAAGGKLAGEPTDIPGIGTYVNVIDTEGNRVAMLQPLPMPARG